LEVVLEESSIKTIARFYEKTAIILIIKKLPSGLCGHVASLNLGGFSLIALENNPEIYFTSRRNLEN
jgi:hypothetical protein